MLVCILLSSYNDEPYNATNVSSSVPKTNRIRLVKIESRMAIATSECRGATSIREQTDTNERLQ